jgi:hypothetical protein
MKIRQAMRRSTLVMLVVALGAIPTLGSELAVGRNSLPYGDSTHATVRAASAQSPAVVDIRVGPAGQRTHATDPRGAWVP